MHIENDRQRHARQKERQERREKIKRQSIHVERITHEQPKTKRNRERIQSGHERRRVHRQRECSSLFSWLPTADSRLPPFRLPAPDSFPNMNRKSTKSPPEQSNGDRHEREVIPDAGGINSSESDFENQTRKSYEKNRDTSA